MDSLSTKVVATAAVAGIGLWVLWGRKKSWGGKSSGAVSQLDAVGGHGSKANKGPPILSRDGMILKPFQPAQPGKGKSRGELEADFYKEVNEKNLPIKEFIPKYHGTQVHDGVTYLVMENMTYGLKQPCVLDLKMGQRTYDETATAKKIEREKKKYPPQETIGFRIVGMKVFRPQTGETWRSERDWCMQITPETMPNAIEQFFFDGRVIRREVIEQVQSQLNAIEIMLKEHPMWRMYGSSLLLVFDGAEETPKIRVKMIDFAHIFDIKDGGVDSGYLHGVKFLKNSLDSILSNVSGSM